MRTKRTGLFLSLEVGDGEDDGAGLVTNQGLEALDLRAVLSDPLRDGLDGTDLGKDVDARRCGVQVGNLDVCGGARSDGGRGGSRRGKGRYAQVGGLLAMGDDIVWGAMRDAV